MKGSAAWSLIAAVVGSCSLWVNANAEEKEVRDVLVTVKGARACKDWTSERRQSQREGPHVGSLVIEFWVLGYLSAKNMSAYPAKDRLDTISSDTTFEWIDKYCRDNPTAHIGTAAEALFKELNRLVQ